MRILEFESEEILDKVLSMAVGSRKKICARGLNDGSLANNRQAIARDGSHSSILQLNV
jgi:hypothetical protein